VHFAIRHPILRGSADCYKAPYARIRSALKYGLQFALIFEALQVAVAIDQFHCYKRLWEFFPLESAN
jgi:hypothetical protein